VARPQSGPTERTTRSITQVVVCVLLVRAGQSLGRTRTTRQPHMRTRRTRTVAATDTRLRIVGVPAAKGRTGVVAIPRAGAAAVIVSVLRIPRIVPARRRLNEQNGRSSNIIYRLLGNCLRILCPNRSMMIVGKAGGICLVFDMADEKQPPGDVLLALLLLYNPSKSYLYMDLSCSLPGSLF
jgi:hypothetical protein